MSIAELRKLPPNEKLKLGRVLLGGGCGVRAATFKEPIVWTEAK